MTEPFKLILVFQNEAPTHSSEKRETMSFENVKDWGVKNSDDGYRVITVELFDGTMYNYYENDQFELIKSQMFKRNNPIHEVHGEMVRQVTKWGQQNHPSFTLQTLNTPDSELAKLVCDNKSRLGCVSWTDIFLEEVYEAVDEAKAGNLDKLRTELIQCAAVALSWVESIDRNKH